MRHDACYNAAGHNGRVCDATPECEAAAPASSSTSLKVRHSAPTAIEAAGAMNYRAHNPSLTGTKTDHGNRESP